MTERHPPGSSELRRDCPGIDETVNPASAERTLNAKTAKRPRNTNAPACPFLAAVAIVSAVARAGFGLDSHDPFTTCDMKAGDGNRRAVWIGPTETDEFELARGVLASRLETTVLEESGGEDGRLDPSGPLLACLAADGPTRAVHETALRLARRWPLCRFAAISSSLCEGRRRSGPPTPGVEEIPWHELPGRLRRVAGGHHLLIGVEAVDRVAHRQAGRLESPLLWHRRPALGNGFRP